MNDILIKKADILTHEAYKVTKHFPQSELFGLTSQLRRASVSVILNAIEGFARNRKKEYIRFLETSYGSLKETKYLFILATKSRIITVRNTNE